MTSEGKLLSVIPVLYDPYGVPFTLPEARYILDNNQLGYQNGAEPVRAPYRYRMERMFTFPRLGAFPEASLAIDLELNEYQSKTGPFIVVNSDTVRVEH